MGRTGTSSLACRCDQVPPLLIHSLRDRLHSLLALLQSRGHSVPDPQEQLIYTIDVLSDGSRNPDDIKKDILADTGMVPSIYEHGTHYVVNQKISLETLEKIQKYPDVQEIRGEYSGSFASTGAANELVK